MTRRSTIVIVALSMYAAMLAIGTVPAWGGSPALSVRDHATVVVLPSHHASAIAGDPSEPFFPFFSLPEAWNWDYWQSKPLPARLIDLPVDPIATEDDREKVQAMKAGMFQPVHTYPALPLGVPPPWDINPYASSTWDLWRHSLAWTEPLVKVWLTDGDEESFALMREIIEDWWTHNAVPPGASAYAWKENAVAWRSQRLLWFWEMYRTHTGPEFDGVFAPLLVEVLEAQARRCADDTYYYPHSNHGLMLTTSLLEVVGTLPEFRDAPTWRTVIDARMSDYIVDNFSTAGFHMEQTPSYHKYLVDRLARMAAFAEAVGMAPIPQMDETARAAASLVPWLSRPNGKLIGIGDCSNSSTGNYPSRWAEWWPDDPPEAAPSTLPNPRQDDSSFLVDFDSGYSIFSAGPPYVYGGSGSASDTYATFRCNSTPYTNHVHSDALSFSVYGLGRNWLIDPGGPFNYASGYPRAFFVGYRAHNVLLVDEAGSWFATVELVAFDRRPEGDFVESRHCMDTATQVRRFTFRPPREFEVHDVVTAVDGSPHVYSQLFHVHDDVVIQIVSDTHVEIVASNGSRCVIHQQASSPGQWQVISAQTEPYWQGWYTAGYGQLDPAPAIYYSTVTPQLDWDVTSTIRILPAVHDGDVPSFIDCMSGPNVAYPPGCDASDINIDFDTDLGDFALFQRLYTGAQF